MLITGAAGSIGSRLAQELGTDYDIVGIDMPGKEAPYDLVGIDLTTNASVQQAFHDIRDRKGTRLAAVIHLAAYFDFSGEPSPLYEAVNEAGTRRLLDALQAFEVERFIYASTMLVHAPCEPGELINEESELAPGWAYPESKLRTEKIIAESHGRIPYLLLRLAGLYDDSTAVPTLSHQIARIYERNIKSRLYSGDPATGQAFIHLDDLVDLFRRAVERRAELPEDCVILAGEGEVMSYQALQDEIGSYLHGEEEWATLSIPPSVARAGAWLEVQFEPLIPDDFDEGEAPFIRPFMVDMADDHFALHTKRARDLLGWEAQHRIVDELPRLLDSLQADPLGWYEANGLTPPHWMRAADRRDVDVEELRAHHEKTIRRAHRANLWAHWVNMGLGVWLMSSPPLLGYTSTALQWSDGLSGLALLIFASLSLSWRMAWARWVCAGIGSWLLLAPLLFWAPTPAAYLNDTVCGILVIGFAVLVRPAPGVSPVAAHTGPTLPKGWDYSPSSWFQRIPIIILALIGLLVSRYLAAYQLDYVPGVWEPFFGSSDPGKNGTESIITSSVSEAWPVPDAGLGALTYALEILVGMIGSSRRWRTMPWLVMLFGIMIVPLGAVSIFFIIIQPILLGTYCTLCLITAAAMLIQIPYSVDEIVATGQFLARRKRAGHPLWRVFFIGDTDEGEWQDVDDHFLQNPRGIVREMVSGGVSLPWNLAGCLLVG